MINDKSRTAILEAIQCAGNVSYWLGMAMAGRESGLSKYADTEADYIKNLEEKAASARLSYLVAGNHLDDLDREIALLKQSLIDEAEAAAELAAA